MEQRNSIPLLLTYIGYQILLAIFNIFYNPNIRPFEEYERRRQENERLCRKFGVPFISLEYDNENWCKATQGLTSEPERGRRCDICFEMRLRKVAKYAQEHGFGSDIEGFGQS